MEDGFWGEPRGIVDGGEIVGCISQGSRYGTSI